MGKQHKLREEDEEETGQEDKENQSYRPCSPSSDGDSSDRPIIDISTLPFDHPGDGYILFDPKNPQHYGVVNRQSGGYHKYVRYDFSGPDPMAYGCDGKDMPILQIRLTARPAKTLPNCLDDQQPLDDDFAIFYPWHNRRGDIDLAIEAHKDIGIEADVLRYRRIMAERRKLRQKALEGELLQTRNQEAKEELEQRLYRARASTRIEITLKTLKRVAPYRTNKGWCTIPELKAGAGPADGEYQYKRDLNIALSHQDNTRYPETGGWYCKKCQSKRAYHTVQECPYNKRCLYCYLPGHWSYECAHPIRDAVNSLAWSQPLTLKQVLALGDRVGRCAMSPKI